MPELCSASCDVCPVGNSELRKSVLFDTTGFFAASRVVSPQLELADFNFDLFGGLPSFDWPFWMRIGLFLTRATCGTTIWSIRLPPNAMCSERMVK
jgi:hypothetical protein